MDFEKGLLRRTGLAATTAGALLLAALPGAEPALAGDGNMFSSITNFFKEPFGGKSEADHNTNGAIDYRPRPALVVPPTYNLPPPQKHVQRSADWPKDPDAAALRRARADSRQPAPRSDDLTAAADPAAANSAPADQPEDKRIAIGGGNPGQCTSWAGIPICLSTPWKLFHPGGDNSEVYLTGTPTRKYLVDPPVNYLEPAVPGQSADDTRSEPDEKVSRVSSDKARPPK